MYILFYYLIIYYILFFLEDLSQKRQILNHPASSLSLGAQSLHEKVISFTPWEIILCNPPHLKYSELISCHPLHCSTHTRHSHPLPSTWDHRPRKKNSCSSSSVFEQTFLPISVKGSEMLPHSQANKLACYSFKMPIKDKRPWLQRPRLNDFQQLWQPEYSEYQPFLALVPKGPVPTGDMFEDQVTPVHSTGCITGEELRAQGTRILQWAVCGSALGCRRKHILFWGGSCASITQKRIWNKG